MKNRHTYPEVKNSPECLEIVYRAEYGNNYVSAVIDNKADFTIIQSFEFEREIREKLKQRKFITTSRPKLNMRFIELNYRKDPFNNKELRQTVRDLFLYKISKEKYYEVDPSFIPKGGIGYIKFLWYSYSRSLGRLKVNVYERHSGKDTRSIRENSNIDRKSRKDY